MEHIALLRRTEHFGALLICTEEMCLEENESNKISYLLWDTFLQYVEMDIFTSDFRSHASEKCLVHEA